jgi:hypothetical protein
LLTRAPETAYMDYVVTIARADGDAGQIARMVKLADLDDHLAHGWEPSGAPPYAWARRCVANHMSGGACTPPAMVVRAGRDIDGRAGLPGRHAASILAQ